MPQAGGFQQGLQQGMANNVNTFILVDWNGDGLIKKIHIWDLNKEQVFQTLPRAEQLACQFAQTLFRPHTQQGTSQAQPRQEPRHGQRGQRGQRGQQGQGQQQGQQHGQEQVQDWTNWIDERAVLHVDVWPVDTFSSQEYVGREGFKQFFHELFQMRFQGLSGQGHTVLQTNATALLDPELQNLYLQMMRLLASMGVDEEVVFSDQTTVLKKCTLGHTRLFSRCVFDPNRPVIVEAEIQFTNPLLPWELNPIPSTMLTGQTGQQRGRGGH
jgi:hypothetical protein